MSSSFSKEINLVRCMKCRKIMKCSRYDTWALFDHIRTDHPEVDIVDLDTKVKRTIGTDIRTPSPQRYQNSYAKGSSTYLGDQENIDDRSCAGENCGSEKGLSNHEDEGGIKQTPRQPQYVKDLDMSQYSIGSEILEKYPEIKECEYSPHNPNAQVIYTRRYKVSTPSPTSASILNQPFQRTLYRESLEKWCPADGNIYCPKCGSNKRPLIKTKADRFTYSDWSACCLFSCWPFCFIPWLLPGQNQEYLYCANCKTFLGLYDRNTNCVRPNRLYVPDEKEYSNQPSNQPGDKPEPRKWDDIEESKMIENESPPPQSSMRDSAKSNQLSSIIINGRELPPETVARIQKYKKYGSLIGIDFDAITNSTDSPSSTKRDDNTSRRTNIGKAAPSVAKRKKKSVKENV